MRDISIFFVSEAAVLCKNISFMKKADEKGVRVQPLYHSHSDAIVGAAWEGGRVSPMAELAEVNQQKRLVPSPLMCQGK